MTALRYDVFVTPPIPQHSGTLNLPSGEPIAWSPLSTTLIYGERDAVLVDPPFTSDTTRDVLDWVEGIGRNITDVYITHGHGDHWFGTPVVLERFPNAIVRATAGTKGHMTSPDLPASRASFWDALFPGQIPTTPLDVHVVDGQGWHLEGEQLVPIEVGHSDGDDSTVLWVPSLKLVVAGDVVYNGVHPSLAEAAGAGLDAWRHALHTVQGLGAEIVVAGHKDPTRADDPADIGHTHRYLDDVQQHLKGPPTPMEFFETMTSLHPQRLNPGVLWFGALTLLADNPAR
jgi:glyoxylase-like metal-dependent hydrolase (beta-lactamase superfamily II)